ncbi:hypothetical protein [Oceanobacillus oncorhynchi]|nr:hypothetical protein [Oceanobacillus oncorhynchi]
MKKIIIPFLTALMVYNVSIFNVDFSESNYEDVSVSVNKILKEDDLPYEH